MADLEKEINLTVSIKGGAFEVDGTGLEFLKNRQIQIIANHIRRAIKRKRAALRLKGKQEEIKVAKVNEEKEAKDLKAKKAAIIKATQARILEKQKAAGANSAGELKEVKSKVPPKSGTKSDVNKESES